MLLSSLMFLVGTAEAATYDRLFCFKLTSDLIDATPLAGDDYITVNGDYAAKYGYTTIYDTTDGYPIYQGYLSSFGCTPAIPIDTTHEYDATLISWVNSPGGQQIKVLQGRENQVAFSSTAHITSIFHDITIIVDGNLSGNEWVNTMLTATHAILRHPNAWPTDADDYLFFMEAGNGTNDITNMQYYEDDGLTPLANPGVVIDTARPSSQRKYIIVHEQGHLLEYKLHCSEGGGDCGNITAYAMKIDYDAPGDACQVQGTNDSHYYNSKEWQSAAAVEGWAHYIAAFAFNHPSGNTCRIVSNQFIPWNYISSGQQSDGDTNLPFSCEGAENASWDVGGAEYTTPPNPVQARDMYAQFCLGTGGDDFNRGIEVDWLRFWWDFNRTPGVGIRAATDVVTEMGSNDWCPDGFYWDGTLCPENTGDWPGDRVTDAMSSLGYTSIWSDIKDNGVAR